MGVARSAPVGAEPTVQRGLQLGAVAGTGRDSEEALVSSNASAMVVSFSFLSCASLSSA